jgi:hypothetical protein
VHKDTVVSFSAVSFLFGVIDTKISRERASTNVINVLCGTVSARDIEHMFMNLLDANVWRWTARPISDSTHRFLAAEMVQEWSHIRTMSMKEGNAQIQIDPGPLQVAARECCSRGGSGRQISLMIRYLLLL